MLITLNAQLRALFRQRELRLPHRLPALHGLRVVRPLHVCIFYAWPFITFVFVTRFIAAWAQHCAPRAAWCVQVKAARSTGRCQLK
jgi:hypothetical protein